MTRQPEQRLRIARLAISVAASFVLFLGRPAIARSSGENDAGRGVAAAAATRTSPGKRSKQRLVEERAMASAMAGKRDPFKVPLPPDAKGSGDGIEGPLPPGARGLVIGYLRLKGIVREEDSKTMIAVVANRANLAYFLHIHQDVYNGVVSSITPNAVYFQKRSLDSSGRIIARMVVLKLGSAPQEAR
jgi:hypothetical protein